MIVLFIHQNYPGQYLHLARHLGADPGHQVLFLTQKAGAPIPGVEQVVYTVPHTGRVGGHPFNQNHESATRTALAVLGACRILRDRGIVPDLVIGHAGWGETMLVKQAYPDTPVLAYFEYFYQHEGADVGYDPEFAPARLEDAERLWLRNSVNHLSLLSCDLGHTATQWQRSLFPPASQPHIAVLHEGVDTDEVRPDPAATLDLPNGRRLRAGDEVLTYVARTLEPYRGFHALMRALPAVLRERPKAQVVIVGAEGVTYGDHPPYGGSWRQLMLAEVGEFIDPARVHFLGQVPRATYLRVLQVSRLHVYLSYPFVLSWSCVEALAAGCLVLGSDVPSVAEAIRDGHNGLLVPMLDRDALAQRIVAALAKPKRLNRLRQQARADAIERWDLQRQVLPRWMETIRSLVLS